MCPLLSSCPSRPYSSEAEWRQPGPGYIANVGDAERSFLKIGDLLQRESPRGQRPTNQHHRNAKAFFFSEIVGLMEPARLPTAAALAAVAAEIPLRRIIVQWRVKLTPINILSVQ